MAAMPQMHEGVALQRTAGVHPVQGAGVQARMGGAGEAQWVAIILHA